ncbi:hypothetical protein EST38_g6539 [Candolleomyces aberdarensis]|uniref:Uncharacterized protein n=1 Tax=Candolleomyces aberdarensis TaxID=2316362 RepID=A0A4Q2DJE5_9AGAR|nr:hypothetical protein EST38_g6539 [Candolleomyces aberdarensis]
MESPFQAHLNTNYSPSDTEKFQITHYVNGLQAELKVLDTELEELRSRSVAADDQLNPADVGLTEVEQQMAALSNKRIQKIRSIEQHTALLNPIHSIPIDILQSIFERCVNDPAPFASTQLDTDLMSPCSCPMLLTFVCSSWRRVALSCPRLWGKPYIFIPAQTGGISHVRWIEILKNRAQLIHLWLSRAGTRPLTIAVSSPPGLENNDGFHAIGEAIIAFSSQWERLRVQGSNSILQSLLAVPKRLVPSLKSVDLTYGTFPGAIETDIAIGKPDCLISTPSLRCIRLAGTSLRTFQSIPLPWSQLRDIRFGRLTESQGNSFNDREALELLEQCPLLQRCELYVPEGWVLQEPRSASPVILPHLTHLDFTHSQNAVGLFLSLELPALMTLIYSTLDGAESLGILLKRCAGTLRRLVVDAHRISAEDLLPMLSQTVHLESLGLAYRACERSTLHLMTDKLLEGLTPSISEENTSPATGFYCPNLQKIGFHVSSEPEAPRISDKAIFDFIRGRRALERPTLRYVSIFQLAHHKQEDVVAMLREHGVDVGDLTITLQYRDTSQYGEGFYF